MSPDRGASAPCRVVWSHQTFIAGFVPYTVADRDAVIMHAMQRWLLSESQWLAHNKKDHQLLSEVPAKTGQRIQHAIAQRPGQDGTFARSWKKAVESMAAATRVMGLGS